MARIVVLFILATIGIITLVVLAVKATIKSIEGNVPVPRSSERTIEERLRAEVREEMETRRAELQRERDRLAEERRQLHSLTAALPLQSRSVDRRPVGVVDALAQSLNSIGQSIDHIFDGNGLVRPGVEIRVTHTRETVEPSPSIPEKPQPPEKEDPNPKPADHHRKSRYERDPVI